MADLAHSMTDKELEKMERHLSAIYARAEKELTEKAEKYFAQFEKLDEQKRALVDAGKMTEQEYKRWRQGKIMGGKHWTALKEQVAQELLNVNRTAIEYVNGRLPQVYAINYNFSAREIERLSGNAISFELINKDAVMHLVKAGDKSLLPFKKLDPSKDIPWNMKNINSEVMQGIIQGESMPKIAGRLFPEIMSKTDLTGKSDKEKSGIIKKNKESSIRAARTLVNTVENKARHDAGMRAEEKGVVMGKCWVATLDAKTRDWHVQAWNDYASNEDAVPLDDPFIVNGEEMMFPGDTSASPANVYNCRCTHRNVVKGFKSILPPEKRGKIKVTFE